MVGQDRKLVAHALDELITNISKVRWHRIHGMSCGIRHVYNGPRRIDHKRCHVVYGIQRTALIAYDIQRSTPCTAYKMTHGPYELVTTRSKARDENVVDDVSR
jgi:hypothetical protein